LEANKATQFLEDQTTLGLASWRVRSLMRPLWSIWSPHWLNQQPAAATSYMTRFEYLARTQSYNLRHALFDAEVFRRASRLQLALALYHRDRDAYPTSLGQLVPNYLDVEPIDPYNCQPFQYSPLGFDLPLQTALGTVDERIAPGTPVFWSVGAGDARLRRIYVPLRDDEFIGEPGEAHGRGEEVFELRSDEQGWWDEPAFAFALPN